MFRSWLMVRLAFRNLWRQMRRTVLTAAAMIVGGALLIFSVSLGDGTHEDWIESGVRMGSGHVAIQAPGFRSSKKIDDRLSRETRDAVERAIRTPAIARHVVRMVPRLEVVGLASSPTGARPAQVVGVDPAREAEFSILDDKLIDGRYLEPGDRLAAYVGAELASGLDLRLGSRLVLTAQDAAGDIAGQLVRVVGIYRTGIPEVDQAVVHLPMETAGAWLSTGEEVTSIALLLDRSRVVPAVLRSLRGELAEQIRQGQAVALGWREAMPELDAAVKVDDLGNYLFQGIMFGIIALAIVNTVLMSVLHRHREFGLLQALGFTPQQTGGVVMVEGVILTILSGATGIALGTLLTWVFFRNGLDISFTWNEEWSFSGVVMNPIIVPLFRPARIAQGLIFILMVGTLASLYPAYRATRIDVAEAMKFDR